MEEKDLVEISRSIVTPRNINKSSSSNNNKKKIHLNPWDLSRLRFGYLQRGLLFPKPDIKIDILISRLQTSLSLSLYRFYPLAGRLVKLDNKEDDTVSFFISCDGSGVEFVHAIARNIQVTEIKDGIFIGFGYNSAVADANSIWSFFKTWSDISFKNSKSQTFSRRIRLKGWFFDEIDYPIHILNPETKPTNGYEVTLTNLQEKMFHVTKENVLKLEAKAKDESNHTVSSIYAVLAHIWRSMIKHSGMAREEVTHCRLPINMRSRLNPQLEEECFGNVSQTGIATTTVGELMDHGIGWATMQLDKMERSKTDENAKAFAKDWVKNVKIPVSVGSKGLVVTNSNRFDVYYNDFGWGKPICARAGPPYLNGRLVVFRGIDGAGSLDFQACLHQQVVEKLLADVDFNKYVSIV